MPSILQSEQLAQGLEQHVLVSRLLRHRQALAGEGQRRRKIGAHEGDPMEGPERGIDVRSVRDAPS